MRSIERTLAAWVLSALTLGAILVTGVAYWVTLEEMHEVFDADLKNVAQALALYLRAGHRPPMAPRGTAHDQQILTFTWTAQGERTYASDPRVDLPYTRNEGLSRVLVGGEEWIVYSAVGDGGVAQAAQRTSARQDMAGESAAKVVLPLIGLVVVVGALLVVGLRRGLLPVDRAARDIARRSASALEPIALDDVPREIEPLVASINGLMARLDAAFSAQGRFLADAAHELRTPATALGLQLQVLERSDSEAARRHALAELHAGIARLQRLIAQLLQIARTAADGEPAHFEPVDLAHLVRSTVAAFSAKAELAGLDLGADARAPVVVTADRHQLGVLLDNLVENALRYTPAGGVVDVAAAAANGKAMLRVTDDGPGIAPAERARAFDRFHRGAAVAGRARGGSGGGLGLAIVKAIAERHGARVVLAAPASGRGLEVTVVFAAGPAAADVSAPPGSGSSAAASRHAR